HSQWTEWSSCSSACNGGFSTRQRHCVHGKCSKNERQFRQCNSSPCSEIRRFGEWTQWLSLLDGSNLRLRAICAAGVPSASMLEAAIESDQKRSEKSWSEWTSCSVSCGDGTRTRTRITRPFEISSVQSEACSEFPCKTDGFLEWIDSTNMRWRSRVCSEMEECFAVLGDVKRATEIWAAVLFGALAFGIGVLFSALIAFSLRCSKRKLQSHHHDEFYEKHCKEEIYFSS
ncbi:Hemicentin-1, partial [Toxocara canis]